MAGEEREKEAKCGVEGEQACFDDKTNVYSCKSPSNDGLEIISKVLNSDPDGPEMCVGKGIDTLPGVSPATQRQLATDFWEEVYTPKNIGGRASARGGGVA